MIHSLLAERASFTPHKTFIVRGNRRTTYGEMGRAVSQLASFLIENGLRKGDRVGILSRNSPEYIAAYLGIQRAGGVSVDINFQDTASEVKTIIEHCGIEIIFAENSLINVVERVLQEKGNLRLVITTGGRKIPASAMSEHSFMQAKHIPMDQILAGKDRELWNRELSERDLAAIIYTSGTTGRPKGVMLSNENILTNAKSIINYLQLSEQDSVMVVLPFCYSYGKSLLTTHIMAGGTMVLENSFMYPNTVFDKMIEEGVTGFAGVPSTFSIMLNRSNFRNYRFPKLRYVTQAGGAMPPQHARELSELLPSTKIFIMYGQTEATARLTYLDPGEILNRPGSIGKPVSGVEIQIIQELSGRAPVGEEGELVASGKNIMMGYWKDPEATSKVLRDGMLHTGDIGRADAEGFIYLTGRRSDMIKSGAHRVSPKEIEEVILEMGEVCEACVVGVPDDILGESIRAFVVMKDGYKTEAHAIQRHCQKKLASFKIPKEIIFTDSLPKTSSGKVMKYKLAGSSATNTAGEQSETVAP